MTDDFPSKTLEKIRLCANGSAIACLPTYAKVNYSEVSIATLGRLFCHTGMDDTTLSVEKVEPKQKLPCNHFNCLYR